MHGLIFRTQCKPKVGGGVVQRNGKHSCSDSIQADVVEELVANEWHGNAAFGSKGGDSGWAVACRWYSGDSHKMASLRLSCASVKKNLWAEKLHGGVSSVENVTKKFFKLDRAGHVETWPWSTCITHDFFCLLPPPPPPSMFQLIFEMQLPPTFSTFSRCNRSLLSSNACIVLQSLHFVKNCLI